MSEAVADAVDPEGDGGSAVTESERAELAVHLRQVLRRVAGALDLLEASASPVRRVV